MTSSSRRAKGQRLERQFARRLRASGLDTNAKRMPNSGAIEDLKSDIDTSLPFNLELKNQERWNVHDYMAQAIAGCKQHEMPVVVASKNNQKDPYVIMLAKDWIWLCQLAKESGQLVGQYGFSKRKQTT